MATNTWIGGGNNKSSNPDDWSLGRVPQPGDTLVMTQGVMNVAGDDLAGDALSFSHTVNSENIEINTSAAARLNLQGQLVPFTNVDVNVHGTLMFTADVVGFFLSSSHLNFSGGTIHFIGSNTFTGDNQVFDDSLVGSGTVNLASSGTHITEHMELKGAVGGGLTFNITPFGPPVSLQIGGLGCVASANPGVTSTARTSSSARLLGAGAGAVALAMTIGGWPAAGTKGMG